MSSILSLLRPAPATPAADALAAHDATRASIAKERQALSETDSAKLTDITMLETIRAGLQGARDRRLDLLAAQGLGSDVAAELTTVEAAIAAGEREESSVTERAAIATRQRALLAPQLTALSDKLKALDAQRPDLERAAEHEAAVAELADYRKAQAAFIEQWCRLHSRTLRMDQAKVVSAQLGSQSCVADLVIPLPNLPEVKQTELDRKDLFARLKKLAAIPASELKA